MKSLEYPKRTAIWQSCPYPLSDGKSLSKRIADHNAKRGIRQPFRLIGEPQGWSDLLHGRFLAACGESPAACESRGTTIFTLPLNAIHPCPIT
jgi:hypothetical protein